MLVVGLTGGIASGKSTVSHKLRSLGAYVIDADLLAREVVKKGQPAWQKLVDYFGKEILLSSGEINRKLLGDIIFHDSQARQYLNQVTHPAILSKAAEEIRKGKEEGKAPLIVFDAALLIESKAYKLVDKIWLVYCRRETQLKRLMARDKLTYEQALARISAQMPMEEKLRFAHEVINTEESLQKTMEQVEKLWEKYVSRL